MLEFTEFSYLRQMSCLKRTMDNEDARSLLLTLTSEGKSLAVKLISIFDKIEKKFEKNLSIPHLKEINHTLQSMRDALKEQ